MDERSEWVARFRESQLSLGVIIKEVMAARDAHWLTASWSNADANPVLAGGDPSQGGPKGTLVSSFALGKPVNGRQVARTMKDGTKLCQAFQTGNCKNKPPCPQGQHVRWSPARSEFVELLAMGPMHAETRPSQVDGASGKTRWIPLRYHHLNHLSWLT